MIRQRKIQISFDLPVLMDETKMATAQRKKNEYNLRDYDSVPTTKRRTKRRVPKVTIRPGSSKRRSYDSIVQSGALEREPFVPKPLVNREVEKKRLQDSMTYGKDGPPKPVVKKVEKKPRMVRPLNRFDQCRFIFILWRIFLEAWWHLCVLYSGINSEGAFVSARANTFRYTELVFDLYIYFKRRLLRSKETLFFFTIFSNLAWIIRYSLFNINQIKRWRSKLKISQITQEVMAHMKLGWFFPIT